MFCFNSVYLKQAIDIYRQTLLPSGSKDSGKLCVRVCTYKVKLQCAIATELQSQLHAYVCVFIYC